MNDKTKRRWFQIHLSTAVVLTLLAGVLLGVNLRWRFFLVSMYRLESEGWPFRCYIRCFKPEENQWFFWWGSTFGDAIGVSLPAMVDLILNVLFSIGCLTLTGLICEYIIRRSQLRAP